MVGLKVKTHYFPERFSYSPEGIVQVGGELNNDSLLEAYSRGIFPWPQENFPLLWFSPHPRGILEFGEVKANRTWQKFLRSNKYTITFNTCFREVIHHCAQIPRPGQQGTWIDGRIQSAYIEFHRAGYAHSVECWNGSDLVGGLYGVYVAGVFAGESMFFHRPNASKLCLWRLIEVLQNGGHTWCDVQMVTPVLESFGARYVGRSEFLKSLTVAQQRAVAGHTRLPQEFTAKT